MRSLFVFIFGLSIAVSAQAQPLKPPTETALERFLRYAKIDTQSADDQKTVPSTSKQLDLANLLAKELPAIGAQNVRVSEFGIVYATVPGNLADNSKAPVIGFIAHMDTSPAVSGAKGEVRTVELTRAQRTVARRMAESKATIPDFRVSVEADVTELLAALPETVTLDDAVIKAAALALRDHPRVNGAYADAAFQLHSRINVGVAVGGTVALGVEVAVGVGVTVGVGGGGGVGEEHSLLKKVTVSIRQPSEAPLLSETRRKRSRTCEGGTVAFPRKT